MPSKVVSNELTASQKGYKPLAGWQYERCPLFAPHVYSVYALCTVAVSADMAVSIGTTTVHEKSVIPGGGTIGVTPTDFTVTPITFVAEPMDLVDIDINELLAGTPNIELLIKVEPMV